MGGGGGGGWGLFLLCSMILKPVESHSVGFRKTKLNEMLRMGRLCTALKKDTRLQCPLQLDENHMIHEATNRNR